MKESVAILMGCYNGALYLEEQIESLLCQSHSSIDIWASDDGSKDNTVDILKSYQQKTDPDRFHIVMGPQRGFTQNFLSLLAREEIQAEYYAYADQDDIWQKDKIAVALSWLRTIPKERPALYGSRTRMMDEKGQITRAFSPSFDKKPGFANALMQNIAGGNTMVMNQTARNLLKEVSKDQKIINYDWWTYLALSGLGAEVFYDHTPHIFYRQHEQNLIGANMSSKARFTRIKRLFKGEYRYRNSLHIQALETFKDRLTIENREKLEWFSKARNQSFIPRAFGIKRSGVYCQTFIATVGLMMGVLLKRL